jgi:hypothetical protein
MSTTVENWNFKLLSNKKQIVSCCDPFFQRCIKKLEIDFIIFISLINHLPPPPSSFSFNISQMCIVRVDLFPHSLFTLTCISLCIQAKSCRSGDKSWSIWWDTEEFIWIWKKLISIFGRRSFFSSHSRGVV